MISLKNVSTFMSAHVTPWTLLSTNTDRHCEMISPATTHNDRLSSSFGARRRRLAHDATDTTQQAREPPVHDAAGSSTSHAPNRKYITHCIAARKRSSHGHSNMQGQRRHQLVRDIFVSTTSPQPDLADAPCRPQSPFLFALCASVTSADC